MDKVVIHGGNRLAGQIKISGAKNAALPIFAATLLAPGVFEISDVPDLKDIRTISKLLEEFGAKVGKVGSSSYRIDSENVNHHEASYDLVKTMRASCLALGPLLARLGRAKVSLPGGCAIGERPIDQHLKGLQALGADVRLEHGYVDLRVNGRLTGSRVTLDIVTVTGVMNIMMAATLAEGRTVIENAAGEPEVVALADMLNSMGAEINGAGSSVITIDGVEELRSTSVRIIPDRIEAGTFMVASAITGGDVKVIGVVPEHGATLLEKLRDCGCRVTESENSIRVEGPDNIAPVNVTTSPFPGFPTDMQAQFMALMTLAGGASVITETIFENRFMHIGELRRMGADIKVSGNTAVVRGVAGLSGAELMATDLRASASLILAGLAANGRTSVSRVYHLDRGYEHIESKLAAIGADIRRERAT